MTTINELKGDANSTLSKIVCPYCHEGFDFNGILSCCHCNNVLYLFYQVQIYVNLSFCCLNIMYDIRHLPLQNERISTVAQLAWHVLKRVVIQTLVNALFAVLVILFE